MKSTHVRAHYRSQDFSRAGMADINREQLKDSNGWEYGGHYSEMPGTSLNYEWHKGDKRMLIGSLKESEDRDEWAIEVTTDDGEVLLAKTVPTLQEALDVGRKFRETEVA